MPFPAFRSSIFAIEPRVFKTDKLNEAREEITRWVDRLEVDGDIDRTASKLMLSIETFREVIADGDWIAPYLVVTPETGEASETQMGHYRLEPTAVTYSETGAELTHGVGGDILDSLAASVLPATFYTPKGGNVLQDVMMLIQMATRGRVGINLIQNPSFEQESGGNLTGWANNGTFSGGGSGTIQWQPTGYDVPSGDRVWGPTFNASPPAGAYASVRQDIAIPSSMIGSMMWLSGMWLPAHRDHRGYLQVDYFDASDVQIPGASLRTPLAIRTPLRWTREQAAGVIPENATKARVIVVVMDSAGGASSPRRSSWDDITFQVISGEPLPANRISLPADDVVASSRIQSVAGTSYLKAINDRLAAGGYHALFTTMDGRLTTRKNRVVAIDTATRTYSDGDYRIVEDIQIEVDASNRYNTVIAIKEDVQSGTAMAAEAYNDNPNDPWNIYGDMGTVTNVITVTDAVDAAALQASADAELARASMQESIALSVLPDSELMVHDVIQMLTPGRIEGKWAVEYLRWGMRMEDPLVEIRARRTLGGAA